MNFQNIEHIIQKGLEYACYMLMIGVPFGILMAFGEGLGIQGIIFMFVFIIIASSILGTMIGATIAIVNLARNKSIMEAKKIGLWIGAIWGGIIGMIPPLIIGSPWFGVMIGWMIGTTLGSITGRHEAGKSTQSIQYPWEKDIFHNKK